MDRKDKELRKLLNNSSIDWGEVKAFMSQLNLNDLVDDETCLFAEILLDWDIKSIYLKRLTEIAIECGFDPSGNDGLNGFSCLYNLIWTYSSDLVEICAMLIKHGANPRLSDGDEDPSELEGILHSIDWELSGLWNVYDDYRCANLYEAYFQMASAAINNEKYDDIFFYERCFGRKLERVDCILSDEEEYHKGKIDNSLVLWFEGYPLIISKDIEFVVNPRTFEKADKRIDITDQFADVIGKSITGIQYADANTALISFEDNFGLLVMSDYLMGDNWSRYKLIREKYYGELLQDIKIKDIYFRSGKGYSNETRRYEEDAVFIVCDDYTYLVFSKGNDYSQHYLYSWKLNSSWTKSLERTIKYNNVELSEIIKKDNKVLGYKFKLDNEWLYLMADTDFSGVHLYLMDKQASLDDYSKFEKISKKINFYINKKQL